MNILGVIQARGGSKGIPKKNIYDIAGHPLISYSIEAGLNSKLITDLIVSTDDDEIAEISKKYNAIVPFKRPKELAGDLITSVESLKYALLEAEKIFNKTYDYIIELPCVSPLRDELDIDCAIKKLIDTSCDSVISVCCTGEKHPTRLKKIVNDRIADISLEYPEPSVGSRRQDLTPDAYIRNGAIYAMTRETLINGTRQGKDSRPYIMLAEKSINIDTLFDLEMAEFLILKGKCKNKPKCRHKFLINTPLDFMPEVKDKFEEIANCTIISKDSSIDEVIKYITYADIWICSPCPKYIIDENILKHANKLKIIASTSTGTNHIDMNYCKKHNIKILSLKDSEKVKNITASSEFTFALMLSTIRNVCQSFDNVKNNGWREKESNLRANELCGKTLGIVGLGRIGSNNAKYALAFGMKVMVYDPFVKVNIENTERVMNILDLLRSSDVIMICVHLSKETNCMVDESWFSNMKNGVYFINTSRGEVIDENALLDNLKSGKIKAAGLDVLTNESLIGKDKNKLIEYAKENNNLIITSHIAGLTYESEVKAAEIILEELKKNL
jgi:phosphoglycerate dehydrogenase-like enzyme/CMP-N-acetylneuraminic acid synthetase